MRVNGLLRRARRLKLTSIYSTIYSYIQASSSSPFQKHVKIDDEERGLTSHPLHSHSRRPSPPYTMLKILLTLLLIILLLFLLAVYTIYKPPVFVIALFQHHNPSALFHLPLPASQRVVTLTIDDAPSSETPRILDLLRTYNATATFFVIGNQVAEHPGLVQRIHDEGHELGNHGWADAPSYKLSAEELEEQVAHVEALLPPNRGGEKWFRPGWGWFNAEMIKRLGEWGYTVVLGSIYPHDASIPHPWVNAKHVLSMVSPGGIIIMHDRRAYSPVQLEMVLKGLSERGWRVESLGGLKRIAEEVKKGGGR